MWPFNRRKQEKVQGAIAYHGLTDWWLTTFTEKERQYIERKFRPMGSGPDSLTKGIGHKLSKSQQSQD